MTRPTIGIIGIGVIGTAVANRYMETGHRVILRTRDNTKLAPFAARGAVIADSPAAMMAEADAVILSLNSAALVEGVVFGEGDSDGGGGGGGLARHARTGQLLIDMSSIDPKATQTMAARLASEAGIPWVDAPLSGGAPAAAQGRLTLMMGGPDDAVARAKDILSPIAANMTHMGPVGAGQTTKLINQVLCAANFLSVAEATRLALDAGLDATRIPGALAGGRADSRVLQEFMAKMAVQDFSPTGRIDNMLKDLNAVQRLAAGLNTPMPLTGLVTELHRMMISGGMGAEDNAAYIKLFDLGKGR